MSYSTYEKLQDALDDWYFHCRKPYHSLGWDYSELLDIIDAQDML